ncbi:MAG: restriction endonuclease subunit S [Lacunisphaera sp.]
MTVETFFEKFALFADAPDAVAKMRELVLELAVRGQLSERKVADQSDPAWRSFLSSEISNPEISDSAPFTIPIAWRWAEIGDIAEACGQKKPDSSFSYIDVGSIDNSRGLIKSELEIIAADAAPSRARKLVRSGTVIFATVRPYLKNIAIVDREFSPPAIVSTAFAILHPKAFVGTQFLFYWLRSKAFEAEVATRMKGVAYPAINDGEFRTCPIPIPPLAEQKRIVAKVDELMALCDRLEAQQEERETRHAALARASLSRFADAPTPANLNFLFHQSYAISPADLRKSILTLAVQGKLVPQDPNDEPADSILSATRSLFDRLSGDKKISVPKPLPPIVESEVPFSLSSGWAWCRLGQIMRISSGDGLIAKDMNEGPIPVYGGNGITGYHDATNVSKPTLVIGRVGFYCGSIHVTPENAWVTDNAFITTFDERHVAMAFLSWLLKATDLRERDNATAQPVISGGKLYPTILALPPLAEQRRIVAKVDQLMALVDQFETQLAAARSTAANLLEAFVAELTSTPQGDVDET